MTSSRPSILALTRSGPLRLFDTVELLRMPPPHWLVHDILPAGGLVGLYGQPGAGKSFLAIDLAMCVASGRPWHGHEVLSGFVLYVSAEGGTGIGKRAQAWLSTLGVNPHELNMAWLTESIPVSSTSEDMDVLFRRLNDEVEQNPALVVIDTLARCFDGDENLQEDMGRFIAGVDRLRREFTATVIVVHHTRLDAERERGSTAFRGAADTMLSIARKRGDSLILSCNKQKDAEEFADLSFELKVVPVTMRGVADTSCAIADAKKSRESLLISLIRQSQEPISFGDLLALTTAAHMSPATMKRGLRELRENHQIVKQNGRYQLRAEY